MKKEPSDLRDLAFILGSWTAAFLGTWLVVGASRYVSELGEVEAAARVQAVATLIAGVVGSALSGAIAAVVAMHILRAEQRDKEKENATIQAEKAQAGKECLEAIGQWLKDIRVSMSVSLTALNNAIENPAARNIAGTIMAVWEEELKAEEVPAGLKSRVHVDALLYAQKLDQIAIAVRKCGEPVGRFHMVARGIGGLTTTVKFVLRDDDAIELFYRLDHALSLIQTVERQIGNENIAMLFVIRRFEEELKRFLAKLPKLDRPFVLMSEGVE